MRKLIIGIVAAMLVVAIVGVGFWLGLALLDGSPIYNDINHKPQQVVRL